MRSALKDLPGVDSIDEVTKGSATCTVDPAKFKEADAIAAIVKVGFKVTKVTSTETKN